MTDPSALQPPGLVRIPRLVVAGATSGVGKTTIVAGLVAALRRRGRQVAPFKVGPDYIDPSYHTLAAGRPCHNLDSWLLPTDVLRRTFALGAAGCDLAIVEGVMGLFDGRNGGDDEGSTAHVASLLDSPVILVLDVGKTSRSAGALALGFQHFDPKLRPAGFIVNRVGSETHRRWVTDSIERATGLPVLGAIPKDAGLTLPERHLGLIPTGESRLPVGYFDQLADLIESTCDLAAIQRLAAAATAIALPAPVDRGPAPRVRIAVAVDEAFNFYYPSSLDMLEQAGARIVPFSPLADPVLPEGIGGCIVGGGFPELHAERLAANRSMLDSIRAAAEAGLPIYGECGGLMYLAEALVDPAGHRYPMVGIIPATAIMDRARVTVGYREAVAQCDSSLLRAGASVRAHEFHLSRLDRPLPLDRAAYQVTASARDGGATAWLEGYLDKNILASYLHLHLAAVPGAAQRLVQHAERWAMGDRSSN